MSFVWTEESHEKIIEIGTYPRTLNPCILISIDFSFLSLIKLWIKAFNKFLRADIPRLRLILPIKALNLDFLVFMWFTLTVYKFISISTLSSKIPR